MQNHFFSDMLETMMLTAEISTHNQMAKILEENGVEGVDFRRVSDYLNGVRVPTEKTARDILRAFGHDMSDESLRQVLRDSKDEAERNRKRLSDEMTERDILLRKGITINLSSLLEGFSPNEAELTLQNRVESLFTGNNRFSLYVNSLISKDLKDFILNKEDDKQ